MQERRGLPAEGKTGHGTHRQADTMRNLPGLAKTACRSPAISPDLSRVYSRWRCVLAASRNFN